MELPLRELTEQQSSLMLSSLLRKEKLPVSIKERIYKRALGNPFYQEEILRSLIDVKALFREGDVWQAKADITLEEVPSRIRAVIQSRVDRLRPELRQMLRCGSVIGQFFSLQLLEHILPAGIDADRALQELEEQAFVFKDASLPASRYSFRHVLMQEAVYRMIPKNRRTALHGMIGEAMEKLFAERLEEYYEQLAYHYEKSESAEKAVAYLIKAADQGDPRPPGLGFRYRGYWFSYPLFQRESPGRHTTTSRFLSIES